MTNSKYITFQVCYDLDQFVFLSSFFILYTSHGTWLNVVKEILICFLQSLGFEAYSYPAITDIPQYFMESENSLWCL